MKKRKNDIISITIFIKMTLTEKGIYTIIAENNVKANRRFWYIGALRFFRNDDMIIMQTCLLIKKLGKHGHNSKSTSLRD